MSRDISPAVTVVIPAKNEAGNLSLVLPALQRELPKALQGRPYEILVVDNGSTDETASVATKLGAKVLDRPEGTIASLRNAGVSAAASKVLIFIDADVIVSTQWGTELAHVLLALDENPLQMTGSRCLSMEEGSFFSKYWYTRLAERPSRYINSGHLITTRQLFDFVGGFDESLATGEDVDICQRAEQAGAMIANRPSLCVQHGGYPLNVSDFIARERWHGAQHSAGLKQVLAAPTSALALANGLLAIASVLGAIWYPAFLLAYLVILIFLAAALVIQKFGYGSISQLLGSTCIACLYLWGRTIAIFDGLLANTSASGHRR